MIKNPYILSIESSCDDTSAAILQGNKVLSNVVFTQIAHKEYGGVIPELASREHIQKIIPVVNEAISKAEIKKSDLSAIAVTQGPGLLGSLIVGVSFAKSLAQSLSIPIISVNHMHAHVLANFSSEPYPEFPFLCLTVSGGHTQLVKVNDYTDMEIIGQTIDDAAGEAFDKAGKMLGLPYPAGPEIDRNAKNGNPKFEFSKAKVDKYAFSFSGFKTSVLYFLRDQIKQNENFIEQNLPDLCASIQKNICDVLIEKTEKAAIEYKINTLALAGGVSANSQLRSDFQTMCKKNNWNCHIPAFQYCTDNAGMIGLAAYYKYKAGIFDQLDLVPDPRLSFQ